MALTIFNEVGRMLTIRCLPISRPQKADQNKPTKPNYPLLCKPLTVRVT
jgi:hypothetical protein